MKFSEYSEYKESSVEWLGRIPEHWNHSKIKYTTYLKGRVGWHGLNSDEFSDEGIHLVTGTDFKRGNVDWQTCYRISYERYAEDPYIQLREDDLLITKDGTIGKLAVVKQLPERASLNSGIFLVRPESGDYISDFLYWVLSSDTFRYFNDLTKSGSTINHLYQNVFDNFDFPLPTISEQQSITNFLAQKTAEINGLIAKKEHQIELMKEKRSSLINRVVTKGLNHNVPMKYSGIDWIGHVPEHWVICSLKYLCIKVTDGAHVSPETDNGVYHFVSTKDVGTNSIDFENCLRTSEASYEYLVKTGCKPQKGDILFSKDGTIGRTVVVRDDLDFVVASSLIIIRPKNDMLDPDFLHFLCQSHVIAGQVESYVKGAGLPRLSISNLLKVFGIFPGIKEQAQLANFLKHETDKIDNVIVMLNTQLDKLAEYRESLISSAVTGKIDVRGLS